MSRPSHVTHHSIDELRARELALRAAVAAGSVVEGGGVRFEAALLTDAEGVSITFTVPVAQAGTGADRNPADLLGNVAGKLPGARPTAVPGAFSNPDHEE